jgi:hypothetical protein
LTTTTTTGYAADDLLTVPEGLSGLLPPLAKEKMQQQQTGPESEATPSVSQTAEPSSSPVMDEALAKKNEECGKEQKAAPDDKAKAPIPNKIDSQKLTLCVLSRLVMLMPNVGT